MNRDTKGPRAMGRSTRDRKPPSGGGGNDHDGCLTVILAALGTAALGLAGLVEAIKAVTG